MNEFYNNFCKEYVKERKEYLRNAIEIRKEKPSLKIIQVGDNFASNKYVNGKIKDCEEIGIVVSLAKYNEEVTEEEVIKCIKESNLLYNGIIVQLPLPKHINVDNIQKAISPDVDVDGFKPESPYYCCTPYGVLKLLHEVTDLDGKRIVVLGRSKIVGLPMANLLITKTNATVTVCNSYTKNIKDITLNSDIIISAIGVPKFVTKDMVKEGAIVIDVGINMDENGKICGDVDYVNVKDKCSFITPVPGGIGLITRLTLLENTYEAFLNNENF